MKREKAAVQNGVRLLDEKVPDWRTRINLARFSMSHGYDCILGQLFGEYFRGKRELGIADRPGSDYGFDIDVETLTFSRLERAWRDVLAGEGA